MIGDLVSKWMPFPERYYHKPKDWADNLRPDSGLTDHEHVPHLLKNSILKAQEALLRMQNRKEGFWCGPLKSDTTIVSDSIMLFNFLGRGQDPKVQKMAAHIMREQLPDGGWPIYKNGSSDVSATLKAYWALKFAGYSPQDARMQAARKRIQDLGGIHKVNTYTKFYMAVFGQYDWKGVPTILPELMLFPRWFYFSIYAMSSWTRAIVIPLSIVWAKPPKISCPPNAVLDELFPDSRRYVPLKDTMPRHGFFSWTNFFLLWDQGLKKLEGHGGHWIRQWALRLAEDWILQRLEGSDGLGAIYPGIINTIMAMKCLGYPETDPRFIQQIKVLENLELDEGDALQYQPCHSPIWDTAISIIALAESGLERNHPDLIAGARWLISKEIRVAGDWRATNPLAPIGGWYFEFNNTYYPDIDDTAMVMLALRHVEMDESLGKARERSCLRGINWLWGMQSRSGGWAAFDKDNTRAILTKIPFADHNAMIDPPTADVTARVLEFMGYVGYDLSFPRIKKAVDFLRQEQEKDGSWFGRWGVNYIYGTWQVLRGLAAIGEDMNQPYIRRAADWLKSVQMDDGGWGERCDTYNDPSLKGKGPSTPSQTAWGLMGLLAAGENGDSEPVRRAVDYLIRTQKIDGTWDENECTGTGFPKVYYLEYTMYRQYFPLQALGNYLKIFASNKKMSSVAEPV